MAGGRERYLARAAAAAALIVLAAGCSGSSPSPSSGASSSTTPGPTASMSSAVPASGFVAIVEPFDPGHPAQVRTSPNSPAGCGSQSTTLAIEQCYQLNAENTDAAIDAVQQAAYTSASASEQSAILAQDSTWLAARGPVCQAAFNSGGTIDGVSVAACLLAESTARLAAVKGITPQEAKLKATDSIDPNQLSWYTTPEGSRIAEISTQGDQTGGAIVAWVIIGGADGFVINPRQFYFSDGSFTDHGILEPPNPTYHRVGTGVEYQFSIDYSHLSAAPAGGTQGYVYAPGTPVAIWS